MITIYTCLMIIEKRELLRNSEERFRYSGRVITGIIQMTALM